MKLFKFLLGVISAYAIIAAAVAGFCLLIEKLMVKDYGVMAGTDGSGDTESASKRIKFYKKALTPAYVVKDVMHADTIVDVAKNVKETIVG